VSDRGDLAVAVGSDPDPLDRGRPMGRVVEHQGPLQRHLHRPARGAGPEGGEYGIGTQEQLSAEPAADER